ncbi:MAG: hypothetical protein QOI10_800 [Solirubrobacterales bacterium]|jgi:hypothetical protein|nr:hypothetical protein [Solirubrobacterales bacterium]
MAAMNLGLALLVVVAAIVAAVLVFLAVRRRLEAPLLADPGRGSPTISLVGTAFAVLLAFLTVAAYGTYNGAKAGAEAEAVAVLELARTAALFPAAERDELRADLVCYGRAVAGDEWVTMRDGERSSRVEYWIAQYRDLFGRLTLSSARERLAFQELLAEAGRRTDGRRERLTQATPSVPVPLWLVLLLGGIVTIGFQIALVDPRERRLIQGAMIAGVTAVVAAGLLLVNFLDHPYADHTGSIQPTEIRQTLSMVDEAEAGLPIRCDDAGAPLQT